MDELSIAGVMLRPSMQVRDLGVQVDSNLSIDVDTHQPLDQDMFLPHLPATYCAQVTHCGH